jgi:transcriptional regulator with XRE-family HTH domain
MDNWRKEFYIGVMEARDQLKAWMKREGLDAAKAAARLTVSVSALYRWLGGSRLPSAVQRFNIRDHTGIAPELWRKP